MAAKLLNGCIVSQHEKENGCYNCCERCNHDDHTCPGCGEEMFHDGRERPTGIYHINCHDEYKIKHDTIIGVTYG